MKNLNSDRKDTIRFLLRIFILKQIEKERKLTQNKINLLSQFSPNDIFNFFSLSNNYISAEDIKTIFNSLNIQDIEKVIYIYDKDKDCLLNYKEFYYFIYPKYIDINIDEIREKQKINFTEKDIENGNENKKILYDIFKIEIDNLNYSSNLMKKIIDNINSSINIYLYLFEIIKGNDKNYDYVNENININDIIKFLNKNLSENKNEIKIYEQDIANFIFRYDFSNNTQLNIGEFTNMINYYLDYKDSLNQKNDFNNIKTKNNYYFDNVSLEYNNSNNLILSNQKKSENNLMNFSKSSFNINSAIYYKEKELKDLKIKSLVEFFFELIKELYNLEKYKNQLFQNIYSKEKLFSFFDRNQDNNIDKDIFISIFNNYFNIKFEEDDFLYLIKKYDINRDNKINFEEFDKMISPIKKFNINENKINNISELNNNINEYNDEQKKSISELFLNLIKCEKSIKSQKDKLVNLPLFSYYEMFEFIRNKENKSLNSEDIFYFLKNNNVIINNEQFDILLNYLFFSEEKNRTYGFKDFIKIMHI